MIFYILLSALTFLKHTKVFPFNTYCSPLKRQNFNQNLHKPSELPKSTHLVAPYYFHHISFYILANTKFVPFSYLSKIIDYFWKQFPKLIHFCCSILYFHFWKIGCLTWNEPGQDVSWLYFQQPFWKWLPLRISITRETPIVELLPCVK